jgi:hypothetical protein
MADKKFQRTITKWIRETKLSGTDVMRKVVLDGLRGVQLRSPVKTGRFRGSHRVGVNVRDLSVEPDLGPEGNLSEPFGSAPSGSELGKAGIERLVAMKWGDTAHITNNLEYARPLENGSSRQTGNQPDGIYGATAAELVANIDRSIRSVRRS